MSKLSTFAATAILALGLGLPVFAENEAAADASTQEKVIALLAGQGYDVRQIVMEDGNIEAYALKDGQQHTVYLDADLKIVQIK